MPCWRALKYRVGKKISPSQVKIELYYRINSITTKGGIIIPNTDFTTLMLNIQESDIESSFNAVSGDELHIYITLRRKPYDCTFCGGKMIGYGHKMRKINHPALRQYNGTIHYNANRYRCKECGRTRLEDNPFSYRGFNSSFLLQKEVMDKICNLNNSMKAISEEFNISATQLNNYLDSYVTIPRRPLPEWLGIDELHSDNLSRKHASYICILTDCEKRDLYDVLDSRSKRSLSFAFSLYSKEERLNVKYVTIDMWEPYRDIAKAYFPSCVIAVDPFHVVRHLTDDLDRLRLNLMNHCIYQSNAYYLLKKWGWLLTAANVNLDNPPEFNNRFKMKLNRRDLRRMLFNTFPELELAYTLKDRYCKMNREYSYEEAVLEYDEILDAFKLSNIREYDEFIGIMVHWKEEILNSFRRPYGDRKLSNAFTENMNGKIRDYISISKGISNFTRFRKRVLLSQSYQVKYALTANLKYEAKGSGKRRGAYNKATE